MKKKKDTEGWVPTTPSCNKTSGVIESRILLRNVYYPRNINNLFNYIIFQLISVMDYRTEW